MKTLRLDSQYTITAKAGGIWCYFSRLFTELVLTYKIKLPSNIAKRQPWLRSAGVVRILSLALILFLPACSLVPSISVVKDEPIERFLRDEAERILAVTEDATNTSKYQIAISDFPRADILGMSIGQRRIYISYKLGQRALQSALSLASQANFGT